MKRLSNFSTWLLGSLGVLSAAFSLILFLSTSIFASCDATEVCSGGAPSAYCECGGIGGSCTNANKCVICSCPGSTPETKCCKKDDELE